MDEEGRGIDGEERGIDDEERGIDEEKGTEEEMEVDEEDKGAFFSSPPPPPPPPPPFPIPAPSNAVLVEGNAVVDPIEVGKRRSDSKAVTSSRVRTGVDG